MSSTRIILGVISVLATLAFGVVMYFAYLQEIGVNPFQ